MAGRNLCLNPTCANNTTNWGSHTGWSRVTGESVGNTGRTTAAQRTMSSGTWQKVDGIGLITASSTLTGGRTYSYVAWVWSSVARQYLHQLGRYSGGTFRDTIGSQTSINLAANTWTQIRGIVTVPTGNPSGGSYNTIGVHSDFPTSASGTFRASAVRIDEVNNSSLTFADGDSPMWVWDGTAGNSTSSELDTIPITVRGARAASRATRPLLTVYSTLQVRNAHATGSATAPRITFFEPLGEIADLRAGSSASSPTLAVRQPVTLRPARVATRVTRVAVPQTHPLDIADAQSRVEVGAPVLRQHTVLPAIPHGRAATRAGHPTLYAPGAWDARAVSSAQRVQLGQHTPIHVLHAWARARADQLTVTQTHPLDVAAAHASVEATTPALTQHAITQVGDARSATWISGTGPGYGEGGYGEGGYGGVTPGPPLLTQHQPVTVRQVRALVWATRPLVLSGSSMVVQGARSAVQAGRPLLATPIVIWPFKARSVSSATRPLLGQNTVLPVLTPARAVSRAELVLVGVRHPLLVAAARAVTAAARTGQLSQHSVLLLLGARAETRARAVLFRGGAGEHVRTPTTVLVAVRVGTVDQVGRPASVSVDVRSGIHIHEARGAVLETF